MSLFFSILGLPSSVVLVWLSAFLFLLGALIILKPLLEKKEKLITAFFIWLLGMGFFHFFLGFGILFNKVFLMNVGIFFAVTGSAYLLRIPFSGLMPRFEKAGLYSALLFGWLVSGLLFFRPNFFPTNFNLKFVLIYMILTAGIWPGFYLVVMGFKSKDKAIKVKSVGGGIGIISCCLVADVLALLVYGGVAFLTEFFMALSPVILIGAVLYGRKIESRLGNG